MQRFELLGRNGAGANSTVFRCRDTASGGLVAVKKLEGATIQQVLQEAAITSVCANPHTVSLLEAHQGIASGVVYLVLEHVEHALSRELLLNPRGLPLPKAKMVAFQLALALEVVHSKKVCHGDMKPANVLLTSQYSVKLCDFGSATSVVLSSAPAEGGNRAAAALSPFAGTFEPATPKVTAAASRWYCAPESLLGSEGSPASDIWALGCILAELVQGKPLMPGGENELDQLCWVVSMIGPLSEAQEQLLRLLPWEQRTKLDEARARGPLLDRIPKIAACPALADVVRACLQPDPACRPTAQQLQSMPFFEDLRQALLASEAAAAAATAAQVAALATADAIAAAPGGFGLPGRPRRTSSGDMDVDSVASASPDSTGPCAAAAVAEIQPAVAACGTLSPPPAPTDVGVRTPHLPRRTTGVQAAAPVRPVSRARVSALTATIRGNPFEGDGGYTDLMPQVLRLAAKWVEVREREALGPIAMAARHSCSLSLATPLASAACEEPPFLGASLPSGAIGAALAAAVAVEPIAPPAAATECTTPIAAAAGGCGAPLSTAARAPPAAAAAGGASSPMDCAPVAPAGSLPPAYKLSASVGAVPYMAKAAGISASCAAARGGGGGSSAGIKPSPAQLRSRAIVNWARRHNSREPCAGSVPSTFLASSSPRGGLGSSATLVQRELAAAAAGGPGAARHAHGAGGLYRSACQAARRSFADLSDLASVAEYETLPCDTRPEVKRRRGLTHHAFQRAQSSQPSAGSFGSLTTEASLGSLQEHEPVLFALGTAPAGGGGRRLRRSSSGAGMVTGSPVRRAAWQQLLPGGAHEVSLPQPIAARNRCGGSAGGGGLPSRGLASSVSSDIYNSAASETYLRNEV